MSDESVNLKFCDVANVARPPAIDHTPSTNSALP